MELQSLDLRLEHPRDEPELLAVTLAQSALALRRVWLTTIQYQWEIHAK